MVFSLMAAVGIRAHPDLELQIAEVSARIADRPADPALFLSRGELYRIHRDWPAADRDFRRARELGAGPIVDFHVGRMKLEAGALDEAAAALDRFLEREPDHVAARIARAETRAAQGQYVAAAADYTRALSNAERPQPSDFLDRARALAAAGDEHLDRAVRGLDEGLARLGHPVTLELEAIELELRLGRYDAALDRIDRIAAVSPRREAWLIRRGEILEQAGRAPQAADAYVAALRAIDALPPSRRFNRAVQKLHAEAEQAMARIDRSR